MRLEKAAPAFQHTFRLPPPPHPRCSANRLAPFSACSRSSFFPRNFLKTNSRRTHSHELPRDRLPVCECFARRRPKEGRGLLSQTIQRIRFTLDHLNQKSCTCIKVIQIRLNRVCHRGSHANLGISRRSRKGATLRSNLNIVPLIRMPQGDVVLLQLAIQSRAADAQHLACKRGLRRIT